MSKKYKDYNLKVLPPLFSAWSPKQSKSRQVALLMSGGVDSSVAAHVLKEAGWDVLGITMMIPAPCDTKDKASCCGGPDAAMVANQIGIAHYYIDTTYAFEKLIIEPFRAEYAAARTPNPCIDCNCDLKFSAVWDFIQDEFSVPFIATGHYAKMINANGKTYLGRAEDKTKDQSYFLYDIPEEKLDKVLFPLGDLAKTETRRIAKELNLSVAEKPESMELCFAGQDNYRTALTDKLACNPGVMTNMQGEKIGTHEGIANYTIGQRRGLKFAAGKPVYVGRIDAETNTVALGDRSEVSHSVIVADNVNVLIEDELKAGSKLFGKIRSYGDPRSCTVVDADKNTLVVRFDEPLFAPSGGQRVVLYNGLDHVVAGGKISSFSD